MRKFFIIVAIVLVIIGIVLYLISVRPTSKPVTAPLNNTPAALNNAIDNTTPIIEIDPFLQQKDILTALARMFIERYGTWSNQSNFENFTDLYFYMTDGLKAETQNFVVNQQADFSADAIYYGLTTRVLSLDLNNIVTDTSAEFSANIQQQETKDGQTAVLSKKAVLDFIKQGADWKVNQINFTP